MPAPAKADDAQLAADLAWGAAAGYATGLVLKKVGKVGALICGVGFLATQFARADAPPTPRAPRAPPALPDGVADALAALRARAVAAFDGDGDGDGVARAMGRGATPASAAFLVALGVGLARG